MRIRASTLPLLLLPALACYQGVAEDGDSLGADLGSDGATDIASDSSDAGSSTGTDSTGTSTGTDATGTDSTGTDSTGTSTGTDSSGTDSSSTDSSSTDSTTGPDPNATVCERWQSDRANLSEGNWSGSVNGCNAGDMDAAWRNRALTQINLYRFIADLPPVTTSADRNAKAQECALMMQANGTLSHSPPMNWTCWNAQGSEGAGSSNIAGTAAVTAVDLYMVDYGNETTIGHRRWILSNSLGPTGIGSTDGYSCMWTLYGNGNAGKSWTAWPAPGTFPYEAINPLWWGTGLDESGWTVQSDEIDLGGAQVTITAEGQDKPVNVIHLAGGYGSAAAINMIPQGWSAQAGVSYHVEISGINPPISYDVDIVNCE